MSSTSEERFVATDPARIALARKEEMAHWSRVGPAEWERDEVGWKLWAKNITEALRVLNPRPTEFVLQVGCAAKDAIDYLPYRVRLGLDPLAHFYRKSFGDLDTGVEHVQAVGEYIPLKSSSVDAVLLLNVLDHTEEPGRILKECHRVLRTGGFLVQGTNTFYEERASQRVVLHDPMHPHTFTNAALRELVRSCSYHVTYEYTYEQDHLQGDEVYCCLAKKP
jgi:SAM-dependent methyltransferase